MGPQAHFANRSKCGLSRIARRLWFGARAQAVGELASSGIPGGSPASLVWRHGTVASNRRSGAILAVRYFGSD